MHSLEYIVLVNELEVVSNVLQGFVELGSIVWASIVEGVVFDLLGLALEFSRVMALVPMVVGAMTVPSASVSVTSI